MDSDHNLLTGTDEPVTSQFIPVREFEMHHESGKETLRGESKSTSEQQIPTSPEALRAAAVSIERTSELSKRSLPDGELFKRPPSSGNDPMTAFTWRQAEKPKMDFVGNRKGPAGTKRPQVAQNTGSAKVPKEENESSLRLTELVHTTEQPERRSLRPEHGKEPPTEDAEPSLSKRRLQHETAPEHVSTADAMTDSRYIPSEVRVLAPKDATLRELEKEQTQLDHARIEEIEPSGGVNRTKHSSDSNPQTENTHPLSLPNDTNPTLTRTTSSVFIGNPVVTDHHDCSAGQPRGINKPDEWNTRSSNVRGPGDLAKIRATAKALKVRPPKFGQRLETTLNDPKALGKGLESFKQKPRSSDTTNSKTLPDDHAVPTGDRDEVLGSPRPVAVSQVEGPSRDVGTANSEHPDEEIQMPRTIQHDPRKSGSNEDGGQPDSPILIENGSQDPKCHPSVPENNPKGAHLEDGVNLSESRPSILTSARALDAKNAKPRLHQRSSQGGPFKVTKHSMSRSGVLSEMPKITHGSRSSSTRPASMPVAGTMDIVHMLQTKLRHDEQQSSEALANSKRESLQQTCALERAASVAQSKLEILEAEKEQLLAKTRHDQEQIQSLRKRAAVLENFVHGFSSDFSRVKEDLIKAQRNCSQLMEDKACQDSERVKLVRHFDSNLQRVDSLHRESKDVIADLQARIVCVTKEKEMLESNLNEKVGMLVEQRDLCATLQRHLEDVREAPRRVEECVQSVSQATMQKLEDVQISIEEVTIDKETQTLVADCKQYIESLRCAGDISTLDMERVQELIGKLSSSVSTKLEELGKTMKEVNCAGSYLETRLLEGLQSMRTDLERAQTLQQENISLRETKSTLDQKLSRSEDIASALRREIESLRGSETTLKDRISDLKLHANASQPLRTLQQDMKTVLEEMRAKNESFEVQLEAMKAETKEATRRVASADTLEKDLRRRNEELEAQVKETTEQVASFEFERKDMEQKTAQNLEAMRKAFDEEKDKLEQELKAANENASMQVRKHRGELESQLQSSMEQNDLSEAQIISLLGQVRGKDQEIARLRKTQTASIETIQQLQQSVQLASSNAQEMQQLKDRIASLSQECRSKDDSLRSMGTGNTSAKQELEKLTRQYAALQSSHKEDNARQPKRLSRQVSEAGDARKQTETTLENAQNPVGQAMLNCERKFQATLEANQKDSAEDLRDPREKRQVENTSLLDQLLEACVETESIKQKLEEQAHTDCRVVPETQVLQTQLESQASSSANRRSLHTQSGCGRSASRVDIFKSPFEAGKTFHIHEDPDFDKENELGRRERLNENGVFFHQPRPQSQASQLDVLTLPAFTVFNEDTQHDSSLLSDAEPSQSNSLLDLDHQQSQVNERRPSSHSVHSGSPLGELIGHGNRDSPRHSQDSTPQRILARPNTGSKVARHRKGSTLQEQQDTTQLRVSTIHAEENPRLAESRKSIDRRPVGFVHQQVPVDLAQLPKIPSNDRNFTDDFHQLDQTSVRATASQGRLWSRTPSDVEVPRTPTTQTVPAKSPAHCSPSKLTTFDGPSRVFPGHEDSRSNLKRQAAPDLDEAREGSDKKLKSSQVSKTGASGLEGVHSVEHQGATAQTSSPHFCQDKQVNRSESPRQAVNNKGFEFESQIQHSGIGRVESHLQKKQQTKISSSESKSRPVLKIKTSDSQAQFQGSHEILPAARSRIRSSVRGSQSTSRRSGQRPKKDKSRYDLRFSQELEGR
ncbi:MAG: hypothetical protein Q9157_005034 [Trypethelium eluteriae]